MGRAIPSRIHPYREWQGDSQKLPDYRTMKRIKLAVPAIALMMICSVARAQDTTSVSAADTSYADYHESPISLPLGLGLRIPSYDRINGLALPWGPKLETSDGKFDIDGLVTYRSNLGKWDPSLEGVIRPGGSQELRFYAGRGTFTNDKWIRDDLTNSATALFAGSDARNWFRADRATARYAGTITGKSVTVLHSLAETWSVIGRPDRTARHQNRLGRSMVT